MKDIDRGLLRSSSHGGGISPKGTRGRFNLEEEGVKGIRYTCNFEVSILFVIVM